jgi:hypothetical protein
VEYEVAFGNTGSMFLRPRNTPEKSSTYRIELEFSIFRN